MDRLRFHCKSGGRMCTIAPGFAAVMHAFLAMPRFMVAAAGVSQGLYVPCFLFKEGMFTAACDTLPARNEQAKHRDYQ